MSMDSCSTILHRSLLSAGFLIESTVQEFCESIEVLFASFLEAFRELCSDWTVRGIPNGLWSTGIARLAAQYGGGEGGSLERRVISPFDGL